MFKFLTRQEELLLLTIHRLQTNAYGMAIKAQMEETTGSPWSFGAIYAPLSRLLRKGLVSTLKGDPTPERGGKSKTYYSLTREGKDALLRVKKVNETAWRELPALESETL